jgi:hypothetical protein
MLIDVHAHQFPLRYTEAIAPHGRRISSLLTSQTIDERLRQMEAAEVDVQVLSPANLAPYFESETNANQAFSMTNTPNSPTASPSVSRPMSRCHCRI